MYMSAYFCYCRAESNTSMRLFVIGHANKGKSTVLKTLRGERMTKENLGATEEKRGGEGERETAVIVYVHNKLDAYIRRFTGYCTCF